MLVSPALRGDRWGAGGADDASCETSSKGDGSPAPMLADEAAKEKPAAQVLKSALGERRGDTDPAAMRVCISLAYDRQSRQQDSPGVRK